MNKYEKLQNEDIKTKHHYIPVTYSKAWVNKDGKLSIKEKNSKKEYDSLPTKTLFEKNLNKLSLINEKHFSFVKERYPDFFNSDSESLQQMKTFLNKLKGASFFLVQKIAEPHKYQSNLKISDKEISCKKR